MSLTPGTRFGPYGIVAPLGRGGMGEVYRARDSRLGRDVALKVLHGDLTGTGEWRRRFEHEARSASRLNHPNILTTHDVGEERGSLFIVTELIEGEPLRALLHGRALPLQSLLDIATQIADGLAAAHDAGLTHRDLKPENIMVTRAGRAKIIDFGLAKPTATSARPAEDTQWASTFATAPGILLGTIVYMSPEQARGHSVDHRSDQFSFGCILYEMATGKRPFDRAEAISTLSAILNERPPPITANSQAPAPLRWLIERCLEKEPSRRFASTSDLHRQLCDIRDNIAELLPAQTPESPGAVRSLNKKLFYPVAAAAAATLLLTATFPRPPAAGIAGYRFTPVATEPEDEAQPAWSPDGRTLAYVARASGITQVFTRALDATAPAQITHSSADCLFPFWSPTGTRIYYESEGSLWAVGAAGGAPELVLDLVGPRIISSATISPNGTTIAAFRTEDSGASLYWAGPGGGDPRRVQRPPFPDSARFAHGISFSPDGSRLIAGLIQDIGPQAGLNLWLLPFPEGTPRRIPATLPRDARPLGYSWMPDSRHVVLSMEMVEGSGHHLYELDTNTGRLEPLTTGAGEEQYGSVSPDGVRIAYANGGTDWDLIDVPLDASAITAILSTSRSERFHSWSPSGTQYVYVSTARGAAEIWIRQVADGSARLIASPDADGSLFSAMPRIAPDGRRLAFSRKGPKHRVWIAQVAGGPAVPLDQDTDDQHGAAWSPDGDWVAFCRFKDGRWEVAKAPSGGGSAVTVAPGCDSDGLLDWSPSGDLIAYSDSDGLHVVAPDGRNGRRLSSARAMGLVFSSDGGNIYVLRGTPRQGWEVTTVKVHDGTEESSARLPVTTDAEVCCLTLHPNGTRLGLSLGTTRRDIWILEGHSVRKHPFLRLLGRG